MKRLLLLILCISFLDACQKCNYIELRPNIVAYFEIFNQNTYEDLVFGENPTLQLSDIQLTFVKNAERKTRTINLSQPDEKSDSLLTIGFIINLFTPSLDVFDYPDTTFINYSGIYPQDTLLIDYWHSDNNCEGSDDYPDDFSLKLNGIPLCERCFAQTLTIFK